MNNDYFNLAVSLGCLLLGSAFFSASETAFASVSRIKLKNLAARGNRRAKGALDIAESYDKLLSSVLIGNNIVNITASALGTLLFVGLLGNIGVTVSTAVMTVLVLIFGEISPKALAKENPEKFAMFAAPILRVLILLLTPLNAFFRWYQKFLLKLFRVKADRSVTEAELLTFVGEVREEGGINSREEEMIRQAIEFDDLTAADILTPRIEVKAVEIGAALDEIENLFYKTGYSRLPVYRGSLNNIIGVLLLKDFQYLVRKQGKSLDAVLKPVELVAKSMGAPRLLRTFQEKKTHLAAVIDEYGDTLGIITIEDIIEELVGEIWDEHDQVVEDIAEIAPGRWRALGSAGLEDVLTFFGIDCEDEAVQAETARHITLAAWALDKLDGFPRKGAEFAWRGLVIKVGRMSRHRIVEVIISREKENSA